MAVLLQDSGETHHGEGRHYPVWVRNQQGAAVDVHREMESMLWGIIFALVGGLQMIHRRGDSGWFRQL